MWINKTKRIKYILIGTAVVVATISLAYSHYLVRDLEIEAGNKMSIWAEAMHTLNNADENTDLNLVLKIINTNNTIPVMVLDADGQVELTRNINFHGMSPEDSLNLINKEVEHMRSAGHSIKISYAPDSPNGEGNSDGRDDGSSQYGEQGEQYMEILYDNSVVLKRLAVYPYIQVTILTLFALIILFVIVSSQRAEQDRVWVGLTKETAHQLGTPISSLMAWMEILRDSYSENPMLQEMSKDVDRLNLIAERFSKIGSKPEMKSESVNEVIWHVVNYLKPRSSQNVIISCHLPEHEVMATMNASLFEWVIENLCKNAMDAMEGRGRIDITVNTSAKPRPRLFSLLGKERRCLSIEVSDTGKGIPKGRWRSVFEPGFTTKKRGWGLGLSLAKRIVEKYHKGRIFVKSSESGKGTTFRIELKQR